MFELYIFFIEHVSNMLDTWNFVFWQFSMVPRDLPQKFRLLWIDTSVKTFSGKKNRTTAIKF